MSQFSNKTAVISGGAEGIGLSIATAMGKQGMNIVIGDIDAKQLVEAERKLSEHGIAVISVEMDVTKPEHWQQLADSAIERFGKIHMLVNNAGVGSGPGPIEATNYKDWRWVIDVNLMGVVSGAEVIVPYIKQHGEGGWMINTASMAGMAGVPYAGAYTATKVAVVGMSEAWQAELLKDNIQVSVLCPAFVKTRIHLSHRNRQQQYKELAASKPNSDKEKIKNTAAQLVENGIAPELVGLRVVEAIEAGEFYIFTHPAHRKDMAKRAQAIDAAFERAAASPLLTDVLDIEVPGFG